MERLVADRNTSRKVVWRSRIVLLSAERHGTMAIMRRSGTSKPTVWRWQARYLEAGVDGLLRDKSRPPGRAPLDPAIKTLVLTKTMRETPPDATHWSVRSMARAVGTSHTSVQNIWREYGLKPHLVDTFKVSNDPAFAEKVADVVGLYLDPPDKALVFSVDEKSQIQALDRTQPGLPMKKGRAGTMTHDYKRNGTTTLFVALDVLDGTLIGQCMKRHRHQEFIRFLNRIDRQTLSYLDIHLIIDNYAAHKTTGGQTVAEKTPALPHPLHTDLGFLAQPGRALLRRDYPKTHPSRRLQKRRRVGSRHLRLSRQAQSEPRSLRLDRNRQGHPQKNRPCQTNTQNRQGGNQVLESEH